jgi:hypothetical protein
VQTYLLSFGIASLEVATEGRYSIYGQRMGANNLAFAKTADAYAFLRSAASIDPMNPHYTQAFLPGPSMDKRPRAWRSCRKMTLAICWTRMTCN